MSSERFAAHSPGRFERQPEHDELAASDPDTFSLHIEFLRAHGIPKGEFTTLSAAGSARVARRREVP